MVITKCLYCGKNVNSVPSRIRKYCNNECRFKHMKKDKTTHPNYGNKKGVVIKCLNCGKEKYCFKSIIKKYCNRKCQYDYIGKHPEMASNYKTGSSFKKCIICGKSYRGDAIKYCSKKCYWSIESKKRSGKNNSIDEVEIKLLRELKLI